MIEHSWCKYIFSGIINRMVLYHIIFYAALFFVLWMGAGLIISGVDVFSKRLKISPFASSFFVLGLLTSIPEFAVGVTSVVEQKPDIFVGNLLGGIPVLFLLVIPLLAIVGHGVKINHGISSANLLLAFGVIAAPAIASFDRSVSNAEGIVCIALYVLLFFVLEHNKGVMSLANQKSKTKKSLSGSMMIKIIVGTLLVFVSSHFILGETLYFAKLLRVTPYYASLILLALGTNIPELSLAVRSALVGKKDIAFGDYMGSAAANTLLFGIFTLFIHGKTFHIDDFLTTFIGVVGGLAIFYFFSISKKEISRLEAVCLVGLYGAFIWFEFFGG